MLHPLAFQMPGFMEMCMIAGVGLLIFGKRLPEVGKSLGKGIIEFKKGLKGIEDDVEAQVNAPAMAGRGQYGAPQYPAQQQYVQPQIGQPVQASSMPPIQPPAEPVTVQPQFKFDPYTGKPIDPQQ